MAPRLSKIVTRTGDSGTTGLSDGSRLDKDHVRIEAIGTIDELNSVIGIVLSSCKAESISQVLFSIQHDLFDLGAELATPGRSILSNKHVEKLELNVSIFNEDLAPLKEFILPGGCPEASFLHLARTICRRAERTLVKLNKETEVSEYSLKYLNRLSDLFFILARSINMMSGISDVLWQAQQKPSK